jgi:pyruvate kinase
VRTAKDILELRELIKSHGGNQPIIAKIETPEAVEKIDEIIAATDGIMVARGDLAVEVGHVKVPGIQKMLIKKCNAVGKPVIVATQMMESMINAPVPTRAEVSDVANAV